MITIINIFLVLLLVYAVLGLLFGIYFLFKAPKLDSALTNSKRSIRFLLFPGVIATWPFLLKKLIKPN